MNALKAWLAQQGLAVDEAAAVAALVAAALVVLISVLAHQVAKRVLVRIVKAAAGRTKTTWDDAFVEAQLFSRLSHLVPALIVQVAAPIILADYPRIVATVAAGTSVYMALVGMTVFDAFLRGGERIYEGFPISRRFSVRMIVQIVRVAVYFVGGIAVLAILLGKSPLVFFSGLGAFTAVPLADLQGHHPGLRRRDPADRQQHGAPGRLDRDAQSQRGRHRARRFAHDRQGAELGQDHHDGPDVCAGGRAVQELARHGRLGRAPHQTGGAPRRHEHPVLRRGDA